MTLDIREERLGPHFLKHHINLGDNNYVVMHTFTEADHGDPHDHPWSFTTMIVKGSYVEEVFRSDGTSYTVHRTRGNHFDVPAGRIHRLIDLPDGECVTAVLYGPPEQGVSFYTWQDGVAYRRAPGSEEWNKW